MIKILKWLPKRFKESTINKVHKQASDERVVNIIDTELNSMHWG